MNSKEFSLKIEGIVKEKKISHMDAVVWYCDQNGLDTTMDCGFRIANEPISIGSSFYRKLMTSMKYPLIGKNTEVGAVLMSLRDRSLMIGGMIDGKICLGIKKRTE